MLGTCLFFWFFTIYKNTTIARAWYVLGSIVYHSSSSADIWFPVGTFYCCIFNCDTVIQWLLSYSLAHTKHLLLSHPNYINMFVSNIPQPLSQQTPDNNQTLFSSTLILLQQLARPLFPSSPLPSSPLPLFPSSPLPSSLFPSSPLPLFPSSLSSPDLFSPSPHFLQEYDEDFINVIKTFLFLLPWSVIKSSV